MVHVEPMVRDIQELLASVAAWNPEGSLDVDEVLLPVVGDVVELPAVPATVELSVELLVAGPGYPFWASWEPSASEVVAAGMMLVVVAAA